jgi:hypothetical protein
MLQLKVVEKIKMHILFSATFFFFSKIVPFINVEKYGGGKWQYGGALLAGLVRLHACKQTAVPVHPPPPPHTHTQRNM